MFNNAKFKYAALFAAAVLLPPFVAVYVDLSGLLPAALLSSVILGVLTASAPLALAFAVPVGLYAWGYVLFGDFLSPVTPLIFLPAGFLAGMCMRRKCSRRLTVALTSAGFLLSLAAEFAIVTYSICGSLSAKAMNATYNELYVFFTNAAYNSIYNVLNTNAKSYGLAESDVALYTTSYIKSYRPMFFGTVLLICNIVSYLFTAVSKRILKYLDAEKHNGLPGINGSWEFVLSKSSATVFIVCYVCLFLGGETLSLPQASAFYAVMLAIVGGVFLMAFRSLRSKLHISNSNLIIASVILLFFFSGSILDIVTIILAIIGLSATFKQDKKGDESVEKN